MLELDEIGKSMARSWLVGYKSWCIDFEHSGGVSAHQDRMRTKLLF